MGMKAEDWQRWTTHQGLTSNQTRQVIALPGHTSADALLVRPDGQVLAGTSNGIFVHRSGKEGWQPIDELKNLNHELCSIENPISP